MTLQEPLANMMLLLGQYDVFSLFIPHDFDNHKYQQNFLSDNCCAYLPQESNSSSHALMMQGKQEEPENVYYMNYCHYTLDGS